MTAQPGDRVGLLSDCKHPPPPCMKRKVHSVAAQVHTLRMYTCLSYLRPLSRKRCQLSGRNCWLAVAVVIALLLFKDLTYRSQDRCCLWSPIFLLLLFMNEPMRVWHLYQSQDSPTVTAQELSPVASLDGDWKSPLYMLFPFLLVFNI